MKKDLNDCDKILDDIETVSSARECTGLIARGPVDDEEYESYMNLMKFSADNIKNKKAYTGDL